MKQVFAPSTRVMIVVIMLTTMIAMMMPTQTMGFTTSPSFVTTTCATTLGTSKHLSSYRSASSQLSMIFGPPKDDGSPGDYICKDCGYVFTKGPKAWAALPDNYKCPPCGAPKFRFKKIPKGSASGKVEVKKSWFGN